MDLPTKAEAQPLVPDDDANFGTLDPARRVVASPNMVSAPGPFATAHFGVRGLDRNRCGLFEWRDEFGGGLGKERERWQVLAFRFVAVF